MRYLKISNQGELDPRLIFLMGATTKSNDEAKIGKFGTGLKYAISFFIRSNIDFKLFVGENEVIFNTEQQTIGENTFEEIYCNGKSMSITTHYGHQWKAWEACRELWCNSIDEGGESKKVADDRGGKIVGEEGKTIFYIQMSKEIADVVTRWDEYFLSATPLFEDEDVAIYLNSGNNLKLYKNSVLIEDSDVYKSLFVYDLKKAELNELRQYRGYNRADIGKALLNSNKTVISALLDAIKQKKELFEVSLDWDYISHTPKKVKELFSGNLYMHPDSDADLKGRNVKVNISLFNLLQKAWLPCEKINKSHGGYYGRSGTGVSDGKTVNYKAIDMPDLKAKIDAILEKYGHTLEYKIAIPIKSDFEMLIVYPKAIFSSELEHLSDDDLESTVLIGLLHSKNKNVYKVLKRLVKILYKKEYFKNIFFGSRAEKQALKEEFDLVDLDLPF